MKVAITGASGFVARHLIPLLLDEGHEVRGLARHSPDHTGAAGTPPGFTFAPGDVRLRDQVAATFEGCEAVVHLAASFNPEDNHADIIERGTRTVIEAARAAGVKKLIFLSCLGAEAASHSPFYRSKWRAEQMVRASEIPYTILLPSLVVGNGDGIVRPVAEIVRTLPVIPLPASPDVRVQPVDVLDLCRCILATLSGDVHNEQMVSIGGPSFLTLGELVALIAGQVGRDVPRLRLPGPLTGAAARLLPVPVRPLFAEPRRAQFQHGVVASPGIVKRTFGFEPTSVASSLAAYLD